MSLSVLHHVPAWVFVLLVALIAAGVSQTLPRTVTLRRTAVLPLGLMALSFAGVASAFGAQPLALLAWAGGVGAALAALAGRVDVSAARYLAATQRFVLPGSWVPLALMLGLFAVKFVVAAALARQPDLARSLPFALAASACHGLFSGAFLGRATALWTLARRATWATAASAG